MEKDVVDLPPDCLWQRLSQTLRHIAAHDGAVTYQQKALSSYQLASIAVMKKKKKEKNKTCGTSRR